MVREGLLPGCDDARLRPPATRLDDVGGGKDDVTSLTTGVAVFPIDGEAEFRDVVDEVRCIESSEFAASLRRCEIVPPVVVELTS